MLFDATFRTYLAQRPVAVMTRATLGHVVAARALDDLFERTAQRQYARQLQFGTVVAILEAVVFRRQPSVHSAYRHTPAAPAALYDKLDHTEPAVTGALVRHAAARRRAAAECWPAEADPVAGLRLKQLDGNSRAGTDRRPGGLRGHGAAAPPGLAPVARDDRTGLLTDPVACEDAYAQGRSLVGRAPERVGPGGRWVADRNSAADAPFAGVAARPSSYAVRYHRGTHLHELTPLAAAGTVATGEASEQRVRVGRTTCRGVAVRLGRPAADGDTEIRPLTNPSAERATAAAVADGCRRRWRVEKDQADCPSSDRWGGARRIGYHRGGGAARAGHVVPAAPRGPDRRSRMPDTPRRPAPPRP